MRLLLVEDDEIQIRLYQRTIAGSFDDVEIEVARDVAEAVAAVDAIGGDSLPDLVLLDLRLPDGSGLDVLDHIRARPDLVDVPVLVCSGSDLPGDMNTAYRSGASAYLVKPEHLDGFRTQVHDSIRFWRQVARAPAGERPDGRPPPG